ncbi:PCMD domain-containing protein [Parabacteroides sp.]|uniref:PCMD domain-containing protein n=1 Tax=Parabacteroides sp. TaxID=1869337 RepID=UPI0025807B05|nr:PCMD domain-containing protein [Parabacteroides sp.]
MRNRNIICYIICLLSLTACVIEDDIPYPLQEGAILSMTVEGQRAAEEGQSVEATIDTKARTVTLFVNDSVDLSRLKIKSLKVTEGATLMADSAACADILRFPTTGFASLDSISSDANTRVDFTKPVSFTVKTYQEYVWKVSVTQLIKREVDVTGQVADAVIDPVNRNVIIYVSPDQSLSDLQVNSMMLGGEFGRVEPDPTDPAEKDYSKGPRQFYVGYNWEETMSKWNVFVYHKESNASGAEAFAMVTRATLSGKIQSGKIPVVEYKRQADAAWSTLAASAVKVSGTSFTASLTGLKAATAYQYRVSVDGTAGEEQSFTTAEAVPLTNGSFDDWSSVPAGKNTLWQPWAEGGTSFWDTGNKGATTVGNSNSTPTTETSTGSGQAASLESKYIVLKFAAGNIFTGTYVRTDGTNGVLQFGRPFTSFPSKLRIHYKYNCVPINKSDDDFKYLVGRPDSCQVYIALTDWDAPLEIRTRPSERQLFDPSDPKVIAYGELTKGESVSSWTQADIVLDYRYTNRTPKYIVVVASASKYGDYFTGGEGSKLWLDECELIYD